VINKHVSTRTKHIDTRHHYVRDLLEEGTISAEFVRSEENSADINTKNVDESTLVRHWSRFHHGNLLTFIPTVNLIVNTVGGANREGVGICSDPCQSRLLGHDEVWEVGRESSRADGTRNTHAMPYSPRHATRGARMPRDPSTRPRVGAPNVRSTNVQCATRTPGPRYMGTTRSTNINQAYLNPTSNIWIPKGPKRWDRWRDPRPDSGRGRSTNKQRNDRSNYEERRFTYHTKGK